MFSLVNYKQDFRFAVMTVVVVGSLTLAGVGFGFPRLAMVISILGSAIVGEHMHSVWRTSLHWIPRAVSVIVMLAAATFFCVAGWSYAQALTH